MTRKKPIKHPVKGHKRKNGTQVKPHAKGTGVKPTKKPRTRKKLLEGYRVVQFESDGTGDIDSLEQVGYDWMVGDVVRDKIELDGFWLDYGNETYTPTGRTRDIQFALVVHSRLYPTTVNARQGYRYKPKNNNDYEWYIDNIPG